MRYRMCVWILPALLAAGCGDSVSEGRIVRAFPITGMEGVLAQSSVAFDAQVSSDGNGALRIEASQPTSVRLFEVRPVGVENARLIYRARVKSENVEGQAYLEMWCAFPGKGEYFSRSLQSPITGTVDWATLETPFFLKKGEMPDVVKLNVVINGRGRVWVDDIQLVKGPLR